MIFGFTAVFIMGELFMEDLLQVGAITTTHGVRGEVKVFPMTDDVGRFKKQKCEI